MQTAAKEIRDGDQKALAFRLVLWQTKGECTNRIVPMSQETPPTLASAKTPQQIAADAVGKLRRLHIEVDKVRMEDPSKRFSERVIALIDYAQALTEGVASGAILVGQTKIAESLLEVVAELDAFGEYSLASNCGGILSGISACGITAENCPLGGRRIGPGHP